MSTPRASERRRHPRVCLPFPAAVEGESDTGRPFRVETLLDDLSVCGVYLRLYERVRSGSELSVTARFSRVPGRGLVVRLRGKVVRVEPKPGGAFGVAVAVEAKQIL